MDRSHAGASLALLVSQSSIRYRPRMTSSHASRLVFIVVSQKALDKLLLARRLLGWCGSSSVMGGGPDFPLEGVEVSRDAGEIVNLSPVGEPAPEMDGLFHKAPNDAPFGVAGRVSLPLPCLGMLLKI